MKVTKTKRSTHHKQLYFWIQIMSDVSLRLCYLSITINLISKFLQWTTSNQNETFFINKIQISLINFIYTFSSKTSNDFLVNGINLISNTYTILTTFCLGTVIRNSSPFFQMYVYDTCKYNVSIKLSKFKFLNDRI